MKRVPRILLIIVLLSFAGLAQTTPPTPTSYGSDSLRLSFNIPASWTVLERDKSSGDRSKVLLRLVNTSKAKSTITMSTENITGYPGIYGSTPEKISEALARSIEKSAEPVGKLGDKREHLGGQVFARSDFRDKDNDRGMLTVLIALVKDSLLKIFITAESTEDIDDGIHVLQTNLRFEPDWSAPNLAATPAGPTKRVRVSQGVSDGLLRKQVPPTFPADARRRGVEGSVRLHALIGTDGKVKKLWVLNGDPLLTPMTLSTVAQWEYKPYLLNGEPVEVDTQVTIDYKLR